MSDGQEEVQDARIPLSKRHTITIASLIAIFVWSITTTFLIVRYWEVDPLKEKLRHIEAEKTASEVARQSLDSQAQTLKAQLHSALRNNDRPSLLLPTLGASLIGKAVHFKWRYNRHTPHQKYVVEIRNITKAGERFRRYAVVNPETQSQHFPITEYGEHIWRVIPGWLSATNVLSDGPGSQFGQFVIFPTALHRIKSTKKILVGTSPTLSGYFNFQRGDGVFRGFDIDLVRFIAEKLGPMIALPNPLKKPLKVEFVDVPWDQLLPRLRNREVDLVISSMTATKPREQQHKIRFTDGYFQSHQIIIATKPGLSCPNELAGKIVGVGRDTTNEKAAVFLKPKFGFKVDASHKEYADVSSALENARVDFAIVDDVLVKRYLGNRFFKCGENLDDALKDFYRDELGVENEEYAIAVVEANPVPIEGTNKKINLRTAINEILDSNAGQRKLRELKACWIEGEDSRKDSEEESSNRGELPLLGPFQPCNIHD